MIAQYHRAAGELPAEMPGVGGTSGGSWSPAERRAPPQNANRY